MARSIEPTPSNSDDDHLFDAQVFAFSEEENRELLDQLAQLDQQAQLREDENDEEHALLVEHEHEIYDRIDSLHPEISRIHDILRATQTQKPDYDTVCLEKDLVDILEELEMANVSPGWLDQVQRLLDITASMRLLADATAFHELATKQDVQCVIHILPGLRDNDRLILLAAAETLLDGDSLDMHNADTASKIFYAEDERKKILRRERKALREYHNWSLEHTPGIDITSDDYRIVAHYIRNVVIDGANIAFAEPVDALNALLLDIEAFRKFVRTECGGPEPHPPMV